MSDIPTTRSPCSLHRLHPVIRPAYSQLHHPVPVAWQLHWQPPGVPLKHTPRGMLWDDRKVPECPTGHCNVHEWLVAGMRALGVWAQTAPGVSHGEAPVIDDAVLKLVMRRALKGRSAGRSERAMALLGMQRFRDAGGDLLDLVRAGVLGFI